MNTKSSTNRPQDAAGKAGTSGEAAADKNNLIGDAAESAKRPLSEAARRALAEADARRKGANDDASANEPELGGRGGLDPARYGDWEIKGRAIDF